jgi:hypothetical protein
MRVLPYFNHIQQVQQNRRPAPARETVPTPVQSAPVEQPEAPRAPDGDVFIPSSPVSGVVYSTSEPGKQSPEPEVVIKSGNYRLYQLNGNAVSREAGEVGGKLDLKG